MRRAITAALMTLAMTGCEDAPQPQYNPPSVTQEAEKPPEPTLEEQIDSLSAALTRTTGIEHEFLARTYKTQPSTGYRYGDYLYITNNTPNHIHRFVMDKNARTVISQAREVDGEYLINIPITTQAPLPHSQPLVLQNPSEDNEELAGVIYSWHQLGGGISTAQRLGEGPNFTPEYSLHVANRKWHEDFPEGSAGIPQVGGPELVTITPNLQGDTLDVYFNRDVTRDEGGDFSTTRRYGPNFVKRWTPSDFRQLPFSEADQQDMYIDRFVEAARLNADKIHPQGYVDMPLRGMRLLVERDSTGTVTGAVPLSITYDAGYPEFSLVRREDGTYEVSNFYLGG